jgi:integrase
MEPGADQDLPGRPQGSPTGGSLLLAVTTGIRRGEVLGLRWRDIDFKQGRRAVRQTLGLVNYELSFGTPKAMRSRQRISIDPATLAALSNHRIRQRV